MNDIIESNGLCEELIRRGELARANDAYTVKYIPFRMNFKRNDYLPIFKDLNSSLKYISNLTINAK